MCVEHISIGLRLNARSRHMPSSLASVEYSRVTDIIVFVSATSNNGRELHRIEFIVLRLYSNQIIIRSLLLERRDFQFFSLLRDEMFVAVRFMIRDTMSCRTPN